MEWKKTLANHTSRKGLVCTTYEEPLKISNDTSVNSPAKMGKELEQKFPQRRYSLG
jgi:hypothetical protein